MQRTSRFVSITASVLVLAGLAACGTVPMDNQGQVSSYPAPTYPGQTQYPGQSQYPAQTQYPGQTQYPAQNQQGNYSEYGRVNNIEVFQGQAQAQTPGLGAVLGGVAGAVVGSRFGGGSGRDFAAIAGAVGGAVAGNAIQNNNRSPNVSQTYRVTVQLDNGGARAYDVPATGELRIGDRVRIQNNQLFRY
ncbi:MULTISPECIES: glycine zipper 2TM domain-containing protein [unclassified Polaromonas]|uniref:glycine zipper 2TM domain-containing protein n=1 Tax=unclassified Polaromonas TaxID=2638319 RepID=UPI0018CA330D|nr:MULTISPECIES: glycine zipper 2TM domain-containing protein [unclassified Polaromonas]MBG6071210.1 outer membrane lipoprotein SlyB [Polaromonas sp. CG_9.7]MBG6113210.1 outer membrane lipoprotein SlyB [Polaromonas sp. CG_9.2]MDH6185742.1 outer membrane lipoprotein SlyB [Polaromonas sp. CG_23.6]